MFATPTDSLKDMDMEIVHKAFSDCNFGEEEKVIEIFLSENTSNSTDALTLLQEIINSTTAFEEQMVRIVCAAWDYIKTHSLWIDVYDSLHSLEVVMNFKEKIKPYLWAKRNRYDKQKLRVIKTITSRWRVSMVEMLPSDLQPPLMGRDLLSALSKLAHRVLDHQTAISLIRKQVAVRKQNSHSRSKVELKTSDIDAIVSSFYTTDAATTTNDNEEDDDERNGKEVREGSDEGQTPSPTSTQPDLPDAPNNEEHISICNSCQHDCNKLLGKLPAKEKMPFAEGMKILKLACKVGLTQLCHRHLRTLGGNCIGLRNCYGITRTKLLARLNMVMKNERHIKSLHKRYPRWFVTATVPKTDASKKLGMYMWQPGKPLAYTTFDFDARNIFNRFSNVENAWDEFQFEGTINIDGFFYYLVKNETIFCQIEQEFDMYKHHLRTPEHDGNQSRGWMRHMIYSLTQQLVRQDPAYWAIMAASRPDRNWRLISYPYYTKDTTEGERTEFRHFDINVAECVKTGEGKNIVQSSLSLDDEYDDNCTVLVKGFHKVIHKWWEKVSLSNRPTSGNTTNAIQTYTKGDEDVFGKLVPVPCRKGGIRISKPEILHGSTANAGKRRRNVFVWHCGIREDHSTLDLEKAETWEELVLCHTAFIAPKKSTSGEGCRYGRPLFTFPGVHRLSSTSFVGDALVGARRWDDFAVMEERSILLGDDPEEAWNLVEKIRGRLIVEFEKAFEIVRQNEMTSFGPEKSFFLRCTENDRRIADNDTSDSELSNLSVIDEDA